MKISNETKVGILAAVGITVLILGYNALQGNKIFASQKKIYAVYTDVKGLPNSSPVMYKGIQIGLTGNSEPMDKAVSKIIVPIILTKDLLIPKSSIAFINTTLLGKAQIDIVEGKDRSKYLSIGDTLDTEQPKGLLDEFSKQLNPVLFEATKAVHSLDSVLGIIGTTFDPAAQANVQAILSNMNKTTAGLINSTASLQTLLNTQTGALAQSLNNVNEFTKNLNKNNDKINTTMVNLEKTSANVANLKLDETLKTLNASIVELQEVIHKFNNNDGTLGKLMSDPGLYNKINGLTTSMNTLVDDLKVNPKRYLSIFGRKDKKIPALTKPINDTLTP